MRSWLSRNAGPIAIVIVAAAIVVGAFELIDAITASSPTVTPEAEEADLEGVASLAGLIKVAIFLAVGALIATPIRRRFTRTQ